MSTFDSVGFTASGTRDVSRYLAGLHEQMKTSRRLCLGYPINHKLNYAELAPFLNIALNNLGDPYESNAGLPHTRHMEREVLDHFARLWHGELVTAESGDGMWGYLLSMGATEGNLYALWNARDYLSGKRLIHGVPPPMAMRTPLLFFSDQAHSSVVKSAGVLSLETFYEAGNHHYPGQCPITTDGSWPAGVPSVIGSVDTEALAALVDFFCGKGYAPVILLNLGSTFKGAYDDPEAVWRAVRPVLERHGVCIDAADRTRQEYWIHVDGALGAAYLPYLEMAKRSGSTQECGPTFDFRLPYISSIVVSSHKWFGAPSPGGLYMTRQKLRVAPPSRPEYYDSPDSTLASSRNGFSALAFWYALSTVRPDQYADEAARCNALAEYAYNSMRELANRHAIWCERAPQSLAIQFTRPGQKLFDRFRLSAQGNAVHIVVMPHVDREAIDELLDALEHEQMESSCTTLLQPHQKHLSSLPLRSE
ncbi:pyridoxal-dependent decarboxylase [Paraburkholderia sp. BR14263]|uniref:pyridoxal-dependent decarboxylase n=1 Tax=unclassified Paraburkholderia TaxID=2615204 RepID=UPI0034CFCAFA